MSNSLLPPGPQAIFSKPPKRRQPSLGSVITFVLQWRLLFHAFFLLAETPCHLSCELSRVGRRIKLVMTGVMMTLLQVACPTALTNN
jgi:hypothetical protein